MTLQAGMHYPIDLDALPIGWDKGYVGDFALEIQPGFASGKHNKEGRGVPHIRPYNVDRIGKLDLTEIKSVAPEADTKRLHSGDVLFNNTNSPELIGKTAVVTAAGDWGFSNHMTRVVFPDTVSPKFAAYQLHYLWSRGYFLHNCVKHVNQASVSSTTLARAVPFVKPPRGQQDGIVAEIEKQFSRLDEAVASLKRTKANLKRYRAAVLKAAVEGKLTEDWRKAHPDAEPASKLLERILAERRAKWQGKGKYQEPEAPDHTGLPSLPNGWAWARLEQVGVTFGGLTKNPKRAKFTKKLPYLRVANVYANELRMDEIEYIGVQDSELDKLLLRRGDLLVVEGNGSKDQIGRLAIWDGSIDPCVHQNHLIKVRLVVASMNKWILFWLLSPIGRHFIEEVSSSTSGLYTLSVNKVGDLPVIVPSLSEQEQIIAEVERRLSVIEELEATVEANLTRADRLRQSILANAFAGKLVRDSLREQSA